MKVTPLKRKAELRRLTPLNRTELKRGGTLERTSSSLRRRPVSPATPEQKAKVADRACIASDAGHCTGIGVDPAHLIDRSMAPSAGDDVLAVVPLCRRHHDEYDDGDLDLSPYLEPHWRDEAAHAVRAVGLFTALRRITGHRWTPIEEGS